MSTRSRELTWWMLAVLGVAVLAGCTKERQCVGPELCNGADDDCDGRADEDFVDERGRYVHVEHCGGCGVSCSAVFPTASATRCATEESEPVCELRACASGFHEVLGAECVADAPVLCLPCTTDDDCALRSPGARCMGTDGDHRCGIPCSDASPCPVPFRCDASAGQCSPEAAICACDGVATEVEVACLVSGAALGRRCAGRATCGPLGLSACVPSGIETCNGEDDDCDGDVDETFVDTRGRYVGELHCGECGKPCVAPGPHYNATCTANASQVQCDVACAPGFVDVDHVLATGCECQRFDGTTAPVASGTDANCDGVVDEESAFVHVSSQGVDSQRGTSIAPLRTIAAAVAQARIQGKAVLVAEGSYDPVTIVPGVRVYGGYRIDFRARDAALYPTIIEAGATADGAPVVTCTGVTAEAVLDGFTLRGTDAVTPGRGSTAVLLDRCGSAVRLENLTVLAASGADGQPGEDGAAHVASLGALAGTAGGTGRVSSSAGCPRVAGGLAGQKLCGDGDVSGGAGGAAACTDAGCSQGVACANAGCSDFTSGGTCDYAAVLRLAVANPTPGIGSGAAGGSAGSPTYNAPTNRQSCSFCDDNPTLPRQGADGAAGGAGAPGLAGAGCGEGLLQFDAEGRARAGAGSFGTQGTAGSGGGGGSAGAGFAVIRGTEAGCSDVPGGSGGGGGSGGCGAPAGGGGGGGGASIGIAIRTTFSGEAPALVGVRVVTGAAGRGGDGGTGAAGGAGGRGAPGGTSAFWCARSGGRGGDGGDGGGGGGGGGGCGGASLGVYVSGSGADTVRSRVAAGTEVERIGVAGQGGLGGYSPAAPGQAGSAGVVDSVR
jgi:hypothetical protein